MFTVQATIECGLNIRDHSDPIEVSQSLRWPTYRFDAKSGEYDTSRPTGNVCYICCKAMRMMSTTASGRQVTAHDIKSSSKLKKEFLAKRKEYIEVGLKWRNRD